MTYEPPARPVPDSIFQRVREFLPARSKVPAALDEAESRYAEARLFEHQAHRLIEVVEKVLGPEYDRAKKEYDQAQAATVPPADFIPFEVEHGPRPDAALLRERARSYANATLDAAKAVGRAAQSPEVWTLLVKAFERWHAPLDPATSLGDAAVHDAKKAVALRTLGQALAAIVVGAGASDAERRTFNRGLAEGKVLKLAEVRNIVNGRTPERLAAEAKAQADKEARRKENAAYGADNARRRLGGQHTTTTTTEDN